MKVIKLSKANDNKHKYIVTIDIDGKEKNIKFGAYGMEDYTIHGDDGRKELYINRHKKNENWNDPLTPGFWSRWLLWNKPTIKASMIDIKKRFNL